MRSESTMLKLQKDEIRRIVDTTWIHQAFPHSEGMLWIDGRCTVETSFVWHQYFEQPSGEKSPFLEITKCICDSNGDMHSTSAFREAQNLFPDIHGSDVLTHDAFRRLTERNGVEPLTTAVDFHSDSRDLLFFNFCDESWPSTEKSIASHFDKHTGGKIRLLRVGCWFFLEFSIGGLDDRIGGAFISSNKSFFALVDFDYDYWTSWSYARNHSEYLEFYSRGPFPGSPVPIVFLRSDQTGAPQANVIFDSEPWSPQRAREMALGTVLPKGPRG